jgi:AmmeMemoRadiSam system protein B/AmmeMemoRadiSam system protein A
MKRHQLLFISALAAILFIKGTCNAQQQLASGDRQAVFAGSFYPAARQVLETQLQELFRSADAIRPEGKVQTLIVPHAGYDYSGLVAASGYKSIPADTPYENIFIIASSHREQFRGFSVYPAGSYITPLGKARVNSDIAATLINGHRDMVYLEKAHDREHSIEVQIPFMQYHFKEMPPIVPIVMGSSSLAGARDLATILMPYFTPENLFIISSDFSHYPSYKDAIRIDKRTGDAILTKDPETFYNALRKSSSENVRNLATPSCGWSSIMTMLYMADRREDVGLISIGYQNSGDSKIGDKDRVVGYWAIAGETIPIEKADFALNMEDKEQLLAISRATLEEFTKNEKLYDPSLKEINPSLKQPSGAFVSLYMGGRLRGCIGHFLPDKPLYEVVQEMTIAAAAFDQRFAPVESPELPYISIEISVLTPLEKISTIDELELERHGIFMTKDGRSGTFLPQVAREKSWSKEDFLGHCSRDKAGLGWEGWKEADLYVYEAIVFGEEKK